MLVSHRQLSCHLSDQSSVTFLISFRHPHVRKTFSHHTIVTSAKEVILATVGHSAGLHKNCQTHFSGRHQVDRGGNMLKCYDSCYSPVSYSDGVTKEMHRYLQ